MPALEIFKPGRHTAMNGQVIEFTDAHLAATVAAYDPAKLEAPLVVGHPKADAPAYGWVGALSLAEGVMAAEPVQVDADFAEMVNAGRFKRISASFYLPDAPGNPVPGVYYLRHVGFLGAQAPAVKGLKSASFAEAEEGVVEFGEEAWPLARFFRRLREWLIEKHGTDEADRVLPGWEVEDMQAVAMRPVEQGAPTSTAAGFSEPAGPAKEGAMAGKIYTDADIEKAKQEGAAAAAASFAEREAKLREQEKAGRTREHLAFAEGLIKEGKLLPAMKDQAVALLDFAAGAESQVIEFGEGDGKKSMPAVDMVKGYLAGQPKIVEFGEHAGADGAAAQGDDADPVDIARRATEFQEAEAKAGRTVSITQAVNHVTGQGK
ncbi:MAG: hypothetical protein OEV91_06590 [Desulfobulbaceae bacterium]|nr:hypothetical protein [Desulfobulbaceae bacterium]